VSIIGASYKTIKPLGSGGFGEVFLAEMRENGLIRNVVIKVLRPDLDNNTQAVERLRDEARLMAKINHPSTLQVFAITELDGKTAVVLEYVDGWDLSELVGEIPLRPTIEAFSWIASALEVAHKMGIIHRDLKPSNIRISKHGAVKLLDFGIAWADEREAQTKTGLMVGSGPYMAPERFYSGSAVPPSDVFSLGLTLYETVSSNRFFHQKLPVIYGLALNEDRYEDHLNDQMEALLGLPPDVLQVLREMLQYCPDDRVKMEDLGIRLVNVSDAIEGVSLDRWLATKRRRR